MGLLMFITTILIIGGVIAIVIAIVDADIHIGIGLLYFFTGILLIMSILAIGDETKIEINIQAEKSYIQGVTDALDGKIKFTKQIQSNGSYKWIKLEESKPVVRDTIVKVIYVKDTCLTN